MNKITILFINKACIASIDKHANKKYILEKATKKYYDIVNLMHRTQDPPSILPILVSNYSIFLFLQNFVTIASDTTIMSLLHFVEVINSL